MDRKPQMTQSKKFGNPDGSLKGNRFLVKGVWFRIVGVKVERNHATCIVKNESTGGRKVISHDDLQRLDIEDFGMIDPREQFRRGISA